MMENMDEREMLKFPDGFLWGTSTSAHQIEGNNYNDWTEWEKRTAKARVEAARKQKWPGFLLRVHPSPLEEENYISGIAADHYSRYEEDFDLTKAMNNNAHRFSIEWSRIESEEGKFNSEEIEHYRKVIRALRARGLEPFLTLWHWTMPVWFVKKGGFEKRENIKYFVRFCDQVVSEFRNDVKFWIILNEPTVYSGMAYLVGERPPQRKNPFIFLRVIKNLAEAHNRVYEAIHRIDPDARVGIAHQVNYFQGWAAPFLNWFWVRRFLDKIQNQFDFIGINYYRRLLIRDLNFNAGKNQRTDMNWEIYPKGIYYVLKDLAKYHKPIYITENGLADAADKYRAKFIIDHLKWIHRAISENVDVRGYFHWSLLDNLELDSGFWPRFGLIEIDYKTLERKPRPSSKVYGEIAKADAITPEIIKMAEGEER
jgi:beta-glucosidase